MPKLKTKFYGWRVGARAGVETSWPACAREVIGASGALYRSFTSEAEARRFAGLDVEGDGDVDVDAPATLPASLPRLRAVSAPASPTSGDDRVHTDGSWDPRTGRIGIGVVDANVNAKGARRLRGWMTLDEFHVAFGVQCVGSSSLAELAAVLCALQHLEPRAITICADNIGVTEWMAGRWRIKEPVIQVLIDAIRATIEARKWPQPAFVHVRGHAGDPLNEAADRLAGGRDKTGELVPIRK